MNRLISSFVVLWGTILVGCTSITVKPAEQNTEGLRYYLPQPFIVMTPQEDGSLEARVENIADRAQGYAVTATSYVATHKLVMKLDEGLLAEVSLSQDSSAVAAETAKAAGEAEKARIEASTEAATKTRDKQEEAAKTRREELKQLQDALAESELAYEEAKAEFDATGDATKKKVAEISMKKAEAKVKALRRQLSAGGIKFGSFSTIPDEKLPASPQEPGFKRTKRPGPVIFMIEEDADGDVLQLIPLEFGNEGPQKVFNAYEMSQKLSGKKTSVPHAAEFEFETASPLAIIITNSPVTEIKTKIDLASLIVAKMAGPQGQVDKQWWPTVDRKDSKTFALTFKKNTPTNKYTFVFLGRASDNSPNMEGKLAIVVTK